MESSDFYHVLPCKQHSEWAAAEDSYFVVEIKHIFMLFVLFQRSIYPLSFSLFQAFVIDIKILCDRIVRVQWL